MERPLRTWGLLLGLLTLLFVLGSIGCASKANGPEAVRGDGVQHGAEACDDKNRNAEDGCDPTCKLELGFRCEGAPSMCLPICGDEIIVGGETCDDGNVRGGEGCDPRCALRFGWRPLPNVEPPEARYAAGDGWTRRELFIWRPWPPMYGVP